MDSQLTLLSLPFLTLVLIASIANFVIYSAFRAIEKKSQILSALFTVSLLGFCVAVDFFIPERNTPYSEYLPDFLPIVVAFATIGGLAHRKSGGASKTFVYSFLMIFLISFLVFLIDFRFLQLIDFSPLRPIDVLYPKYRIYLWILIAIQSIAPPILFWVIKNSRLRPGIDKPFDS